MATSTLIIGAGMAGLSAAQALTQQGWRVTLLDKGRGVGGRMATRRLLTARADHGAQYFSAQSTAFSSFTNRLAAAGVVTPWHLEEAGRTESEFTHSRFVGVGGMSAIPKYMADALTVLTGQKAIRIGQDDAGWQVITETGDTHRADSLLITIPAPQVLALLHDSGLSLTDTDRQALSAIVYQPCIAVLAALNKASHIPAPGGIRYETGDIAWIADNEQKGISSTPSVTLHASAAFSQAHLDEADLNTLGQRLLEQVEDMVPASSIVAMQVHRWRYSQAEVRHPDSYLAATAPFPLLFGGDGFGSGNVEGAFLSGLHMAQALTGVAMEG
ncbi:MULTISPECIES: NAD(P)/FAD-dependent oxidoreductase [Spirosoma]|uniref:FAD-dependent oxidoreductase n=1 Tax=Spirosoma sordidisoli TaxID=2502893 RepID=A0A4Q2UP34_9BACT|nr:MULTISPECIES: FAD-dependent oxidoreductase [Spirosoma]RYC71443.1 FAD-dependent oxidoreductase [Spirosoma sordidisoli]